MNDAMELAWAAGLFEGEGSIHSSRAGGRHYMYLNLSSTDEDVVRRFCAAVGCGGVYGPYTEKNPLRPRWSWHARRIAEAEHVASLLEPFLCKRRRAKLEEVRERLNSQPKPMTGKSHRKPLRTTAP